MTEPSTILPSTLITGMVALALVPLIISMTTAYIKVSIVLGVFKTGLGLQQVPGKMVEFALVIAITTYIMIPVFEKIESKGLGELLTRIRAGENIEPILKPWRKFLVKNSGKREIKFLHNLRLEQKEGVGKEQIASKKYSKIYKNPPWDVLIPAFVLSEISKGFIMGLSVLLPFLLIDLITATLITGVGISTITPTVVSLPIKIVLLVVTDGWLLLVRGLVLSY
jgi:type III secretory pathway component EscR